MKKKWMSLIVTAMLVLCMGVPIFASESTQDSAGNFFEAGDLVTLPGNPISSAFTVGQSVTLSGSDVNGAVYAAGQTVDIEDIVIAESLFAAGNSVAVKDTSVRGNIFAAGNSVSITGDCSGNGVYAVGNMLTFDGSANYLYAAGSSVVLSGTINGDAVIEANSVEIRDDAVVTGNLTVKSELEPSVPAEAKIGNYIFEKTEEKEDAGEKAEAVAKLSMGAIIFKKITKGIYWVIAMAAFGMLLCWLFNDDLNKAGAMIKERTGAMIGSGAIAWFCILILLHKYPGYSLYRIS